MKTTILQTILITASFLALFYVYYFKREFITHPLSSSGKERVKPSPIVRAFVNLIGKILAVVTFLHFAFHFSHFSYSDYMAVLNLAMISAIFKKYGDDAEYGPIPDEILKDESHPFHPRNNTNNPLHPKYFRAL